MHHVASIVGERAFVLTGALLSLLSMLAIAYKICVCDTHGRHSIVTLLNHGFVYVNAHLIVSLDVPCALCILFLLALVSGSAPVEGALIMLTG